MTIVDFLLRVNNYSSELLGAAGVLAVLLIGHWLTKSKTKAELEAEQSSHSLREREVTAKEAAVKLSKEKLQEEQRTRQNEPSREHKRANKELEELLAEAKQMDKDLVTYIQNFRRDTRPSSSGAQMVHKPQCPYIGTQGQISVTIGLLQLALDTDDDDFLQLYEKRKGEYNSRMFTHRVECERHRTKAEELRDNRIWREEKRRERF